MILNHNINSLTALNKLNSNNINGNKAMERLSSGLRINRAADDAAGLAISEKMRAQIRAMEQTCNNIQDGISFIQVADSAMGNIVDPNLIRLKELTVQAMNGVCTDSDRNAIQLEVNEIMNSIEQINDDTEMNEIKVFRPSNDEPHESYKSGKTDIVFVIDATGSMQASIDKIKKDINKLADSLSGSEIDYNIGLVIYRDVNSDSNSLIKYDMTSDINEFKNNIEGITADGGGDENESGLEGIKDSSEGALSYPFRDNVTKKIVMITDAPVHSDDDSGSKYNIRDIAQELKEKNISLDLIGSIKAKDQLDEILVKETGGKSFDINESDYDGILNDIATGIIEDEKTDKYDSEALKSLELQVGANEGQTFNIERYDLGVKSIGVDGLDVTTGESMNGYLNKIDKAINIVNQVRSKYGAYQNVLEHISNNNGNYRVNITAAQSRILDADMAKETIELSKNTILREASQSMLSQANKMNESMLNLITKWQGQ